LDLDDYDADERYLAVVNREETGTRLKNGYDAERELSISEEAGERSTATFRRTGTPSPTTTDESRS